MTTPPAALPCPPANCPFCDGPTEPRDDGHVGCASRRCHFAFVSLRPKMWNTRPAEDRLRERIAELEKEIERRRKSDELGSWDDDD